MEGVGYGCPALVEILPSPRQWILLDDRETEQVMRAEHLAISKNLVQTMALHERKGEMAFQWGFYCRAGDV